MALTTAMDHIIFCFYLFIRMPDLARLLLLFGLNLPEVPHKVLVQIVDLIFLRVLVVIGTVVFLVRFVAEVVLMVVIVVVETSCVWCLKRDVGEIIGDRVRVV